MKMSKKHKIYIQKKVVPMHMTEDFVSYRLRWADPITGAIYRVTGTSPDNALKTFYERVRIKHYYNDLTIPWWKFWKRKYTK